MGEEDRQEKRMDVRAKQVNNAVQSGGRARMANLELLRCIAMMMIIVLHYLGKGRLLPDLTEEQMGLQGMIAWLLESFCIVAVNVYMMISGYFLCCSSFKLSRLLQLWLQVWMYSVGIGLFSMVTGIMPKGAMDIHDFLELLFPISMGHYWFMTAYVFLYLLLPLIGMGIRRMKKEQLQLTLFLLLGVFCLIKSILPARLEQDAMGYDCLWYLCVFVTAAYIRRFGAPFLNKSSRAVALYVLGCLGILAEALLLRGMYLKKGSFGLILKISFEYNHLLPFLAAVGLFCLFLKLRVSGSFARLVVSVAPYTLGVYLLHENIGLRYEWQNWLGAERISGAGGLLAGTVLAVVLVFGCGIAVDMVRAAVVKILHRLLCGIGLYRKLTEYIVRMDEKMRAEVVE